MSNSPNTVSVNILDKDYLVACPPDAREQLEKAARTLDQKMKEIRAGGKIYGLERIAVMAALNLTYDLQQEDAKSHHFDTTLEAMHNKIDAALRNS